MKCYVLFCIFLLYLASSILVQPTSKSIRNNSANTRLNADEELGFEAAVAALGKYRSVSMLAVVSV